MTTVIVLDFPALAYDSNNPSSDQNGPLWEK